MARLHRMMSKLRTLPRAGFVAKLAVHWWWLRFVFLSAEVQWPTLPVAQRNLLVGIAETVEPGRDGLAAREYKIHLGQ